MVKSDVIYKKIIFIDTLLSFDGIIPSLPDFQLKLVTLIEQFHHSLISEDKNENESDNLCRIICFYLDKRVSLRLDRHFSSWDGFLLEKYFYGYDKEKKSIYQRIDLIIKTTDKSIYEYAYKLLSRLSDTIGYDELIRALHATYYNQKVNSPSISETTMYSELTVDDENSIDNSSININNWAHPLILQISISIIIVTIIWLCCNNYINGFE